MSFWSFNVKPDRWHCQSGMKSDRGSDVATRWITFRGQLKSRQRCTIDSKTNATDLYVEGSIQAGEAGRPPDPDRFMPKNMGEWNSAPLVHFGTCSHVERSLEFGYSEHLQIISQVPQQSFDDLWHWLRASGNMLDHFYVEAYSDQLTAIHGHHWIYCLSA